MNSRRSYRQCFQSPEEAKAYDVGQYSNLTYSSLLWDIERELLDRILDKIDGVGRQSYLDFACGTGRVIEHLGSRFSKSVGVDISSDMLSRAEERVPGSQFYCVDIRSQPDRINDTFDVITAFRFLLNADHVDRIAALSWLGQRLRSHTGRLLVNNHGNLWSHKAITTCLRHVTSRSGGRALSGNVLSDREAKRLFALSGLEVEAAYGCGVIGGKALRVIPFRKLKAIEQRAADSFLHRAGVNQLYVLRPRRSGPQ